LSGIVLCPVVSALALDKDEGIYREVVPYIKYFDDRALAPSSEFPGFTRSFQLYYGLPGTSEETFANYSAVNYDQTILGMLKLYNGDTTILDTYISYFRHIADPYNPVIDSDGNYHDANGIPLKYGPYRVVRILGRDIEGWGGAWDWVVDSGAAACLIIYAVEAYKQDPDPEYLDFAATIAGYLLKLQSADGGIRYGPIGMYHDSDPENFYWNLKSTEQNERILYALEGLYSLTADDTYYEAAGRIKEWLKSMYDPSEHLYHSAEKFNGSEWVKEGFGYIATDVMALSPLEMMFSSPYFGQTQVVRDNEIDLMFQAIEANTAFLDGSGKPFLFRFSTSYTGNYGSVEISSQMALAYFKAYEVYDKRGDVAKAQFYLDRYDMLMAYLACYFFVPQDDTDSRLAPYASYISGEAAGGVPTGTGYNTPCCSAAVASSYYALAKAGPIEYRKSLKNPPMITAGLDAGSKDDLVVNFGTQYGIWIYNSGTWSQLHTISPELMIAANLDNDAQDIDDLVIDFGSLYGVWVYYDNNTWTQLHTVSPKSIISAQLDSNPKNDLVIDFGSDYGIWVYYNNSTWSQLHTVSPKSIVKANLDIDPREDLIIDFGPQYGIWIYFNNSNWTQLYNVTSESIAAGDINGDGKDEVAVNFGRQYGIWIYCPATSSWSQLHTISPESITISNIDSNPKKDIIIDFGSPYGIWVYSNNTSWSQIHNVSPDSITTGDLNGNGIDELIIDFGPQYGIWIRNNDGSWCQLHTISP